MSLVDINGARPKCGVCKKIHAKRLRRDVKFLRAGREDAVYRKAS